MTTRSRRETIHFKRPFRIKGIDRLLPPGAYEVVNDEEIIEGLSFAPIIMVPAAAPRASTREVISIGSVDLADTQRTNARTENPS